MPLNMDCKRGANTQGLIEIPTQALHGTFNMQARVCEHTHRQRVGEWGRVKKRTDVFGHVTVKGGPHWRQLAKANDPVITVALSSHPSSIYPIWFSPQTPANDKEIRLIEKRSLNELLPASM